MGKKARRMVSNPFILYGYESEAYFCDRQKETDQLLSLIENGNNVALIAPRRIGKTGLIENLYHQPKVRKKYYTFLIDIYATKNQEDMIMAMGSSMLSSLRPWGAKVMKKFTDDWATATLPMLQHNSSLNCYNPKKHQFFCQFIYFL